MLSLKMLCEYSTEPKTGGRVQKVQKYSCMTIHYAAMQNHSKILLDENRIPLFRWPGNSPDNVWECLKRKLAKETIMIIRIIFQWNPKDLLKNIAHIESMPRRIVVLFKYIWYCVLIK